MMILLQIIEKEMDSGSARGIRRHPEESHLCKLERVARRDAEIRPIRSVIRDAGDRKRSRTGDSHLRKVRDNRGEGADEGWCPEGRFEGGKLVAGQKASRSHAGFGIRPYRFSRPGCACRLRSVRLCGDRQLQSLSVAAVASCSQHTPRPDSKSGCRRRRRRRFLIGSHFRRGVPFGCRISQPLPRPRRVCEAHGDNQVIKEETAVGFPSDAPSPSSLPSPVVISVAYSDAKSEEKCERKSEEVPLR